MPTAQSAYQFPGTHFGTSSNETAPPYGTRFRLKASFSETPYQGNVAALAIVRALKKYGLIFADQGSSMYVSGTTNSNWQSVLGYFPFSILIVSKTQILKKLKNSKLN